MTPSCKGRESPLYHPPLPSDNGMLITYESKVTIILLKENLSGLVHILDSPCVSVRLRARATFLLHTVIFNYNNFIII